jgi:hypothetical protein
VEEVVKQLRALGLSDGQIDSTLQKFNDYVEFDLAFDLRQLVSATQKAPVAEAARSCVTPSASSDGKVQPASAIRSCLSHVMPISEEINEAIDDLEQFQQKRTLRRQQIYLATGDRLFCAAQVVGLVAPDLERAKGFEPSTPTLARLVIRRLRR